MVFRRIFGALVPAIHGRPRPIEQIRSGLEAALHDCSGIRTQRMNYRIKAARTPADLWLLRSDLHQCIAQAHSQAVAAERINHLIPFFAGWVPARQLILI